jgi:putative peptidoglycan lipid II flippase
MPGTTLRRLGAAALLMTAAVFASRVIGYLREAYVAARFGATGITDAFYAAFTIPDWLNHLVAGGTLSITFLPLYSRYLADGDEAGANRALSAVMTVMLVVVGAGVVAGEIFAEPLLALVFDLPPEAAAACARMTRVLLPAQLFFFAGGLVSATLFARGRFAAAALAPLLYNVGIIAGGVVLGGALGPEGLAWGALAGAAIGPFLVPAISAYRHGARLRPVFAPRDPAFLEWVKLSLPLMIGVSVVTADDWILRFFADEETGAITRLTYAKRLVAVPIAVAGQAIGQASMPFFARLFNEGKRDELADTIARTLRGAGVVAALVAAWMIALAVPIIDVLFRRGQFTAADVGPTAIYTAVFAAAVPLWALQGIAARAFYAARNTMTPMIAGTAITLATLPIYAVLYRAAGPVGLCVASGVAILGHTAGLLLLVPRILPELRGALPPALRGLGAALVLAIAAGVATWAAAAGATAVLPLRGHLGALAAGAAGTIAFAAVVALGSGPLGIDEPRRLARRILRRRRGS